MLQNSCKSIETFAQQLQEFPVLSVILINCQCSIIGDKIGHIYKYNLVLYPWDPDVSVIDIFTWMADENDKKYMNLWKLHQKAIWLEG